MKFLYKISVLGGIERTCFERRSITHRPTDRASFFRRQRGSALLIVLAFLVLLVGVVVLFLSRALVERQVSSSSLNQSESSILAQSALGIIVGDLKQEVALNSTPATVGKVTIYEPKAFDPSNPSNPIMTPIRSTTSAPNPNLIRVSASTDPAALVSLGLSTRASAVNSTNDKSANGRNISLASWNSHYLNPRSPAVVGTSQIDSTPDPKYFTPPDWVLITKNGPQTLTWSNALSTPSSPSFVMGRYAFAIYDEGGLIDANVAGYPTNITKAQIGEKGSLALADLTQVPDVSTPSKAMVQQDVDQLLGWRNNATAQPSGSLASGYVFSLTAASNYYYYVAPPSAAFPTFLSTNPAPAPASQTDQVFTSRQALIRYQRATYQPSEQLGFSQDALQYLGTFTRALNQPCFRPTVTPNASLAPAPTVTYPSPAAPVAKAFNPVVETVAATAGPLINQPLVQQRFALNHLALFANPTTNAAAIQTYFGLTQVNPYTWTYSHGGTAGTIMTLAQVAALPAATARAPDFFEMLQAAVLNGSLLPTHDGAFSTLTGVTSLFIIKLGANLINQYQTNNYPIIINYGTTSVAGIDDLPYFSEVMLWPYRPSSAARFSPSVAIPGSPGPTPGTAYRENLDGYALYEIWNPHQLSTNAATIPGPTKFRLEIIAGDSPSSTTEYLTATDSEVPAKVVPNSPSPNNSSSNPSNSPLFVTFDNSADFREPTILAPQYLDPTLHASDSPQFQTVTDTGGTRLGLWLGEIPGIPDGAWATSQGLANAATIKGRYKDATFMGGTNEDYVRLEFQGTDQNWYPYQGEGTPGGSLPPPVSSLTSAHYDVSEGQITDLSAGTSPWDTLTNSSFYTAFNFIAAQSEQLVDPRCLWNPNVISGNATPNQSARPDTTAGFQASRYWVTGPCIFGSSSSTYYSTPSSAVGGTTWASHSPNRPVCPAMYNENSATTPYNGQTSNTYLYDADGVLRPGDGVLGAPSSEGGVASPYVKGNASARPIILHRPFRSVAEMGYAFRGIGAWKSVNFFSPESADAGLLDYFSLEDAPLVAGKINLNTQQPITLAAALSGAYRDETSGDYLSSSDASALANAIITHTETVGPLYSRADLVRGLLSDPLITTAINNIQGTAGSNSTLGMIKTRREAVIRALVDVGTTRTWNLLIDVIAQSGRYAPNATQLSQFTVQGEARYWLHVAIDRYTGQVIDQQLEQVNEQ